MEEKVNEIDESIKKKFSRAERYAALLEMKQRQISFLKLVKLMQFLSMVQPILRRQQQSQRTFKSTSAYAWVIQHTFINWYNRRIFLKYKLGFLKALGSAQFKFRLNLRIWRKRRAVKRIAEFMNSRGGKKKRRVRSRQ